MTLFPNKDTFEGLRTSTEGGGGTIQPITTPLLPPFNLLKYLKAIFYFTLSAVPPPTYLGSL